MSEQNGQNGAKPHEISEGITKITVGGYKSIAQEQSIEIRPLTILAGANSSGKSSIMQPLLLMKQTLEAIYDPGALLLNGPNVRFTSAEQLLSQPRRNRSEGTFQVGLAMHSRFPIALFFSKQQDKGFEVDKAVVYAKEEIIFEPEMLSADIVNLFHRLGAINLSDNLSPGKLSLHVVRNRCFLEVAFRDSEGLIPVGLRAISNAGRLANVSLGSQEEKAILEAIHLPGLRGNPARDYAVTAVGLTFPGTFENYTASIIAKWQSDKQQSQLDALHGGLSDLGLTRIVTAQPINDTQVEIRVGRTLQSGIEDMVSIADVGFGVSQTLPVLVALLAAKPGQLVYLEQPEIHLHPRAQTAMAQVLADAAMRGVRVVAETHSSLLLLGVQTLVAEGKLPPELVKLHWFERGDDGATTIRSADLDEGGRFGDWPEDFDDVSLDAQSRYLDAAEQRMAGK